MRAKDPKQHTSRSTLTPEASSTTLLKLSLAAAVGQDFFRELHFRRGQRGEIVLRFGQGPVEALDLHAVVIVHRDHGVPLVNLLPLAELAGEHDPARPVHVRAVTPLSLRFPDLPAVSEASVPQLRFLALRAAGLPLDSGGSV